MYSTRSMYSEDMMWSIFRFQISPYEFCSFVFVMNLSSVVSHQYCFYESIDSESGVFFRCPAMKMSELG